MNSYIKYRKIISSNSKDLKDEFLTKAIRLLSPANYPIMNTNDEREHR